MDGTLNLISLAYLYCEIPHSCCFAFTAFPPPHCQWIQLRQRHTAIAFFPPPTLWSLSLNAACPRFLWFLFFFLRKGTIGRNDAAHSAGRLGGMAFSCSSQQSCRFLAVHNNSVFILHLKVTSDTGFNFPSCLKGEQKETTAKCVPDLVSDSQVWPPVSFRGEKTMENGKKGDV